MNDFFAARVAGYDEHMLANVEGCREAYELMARLIPPRCKLLLDLGCGTGLEFDQIFRRMPDVMVTGIDLTQEMLDMLREKHPEKNMRLICGSYFDVPFGRGYDCAISFQTLHHFSHGDKIALYEKVFHALRGNGVYIECDYMVEKQEEEDHFFSENTKIRNELGIGMNAFYHFDTPCTVENQMNLLKKAGFSEVKMEFRKGCTTILVANK